MDEIEKAEKNEIIKKRNEIIDRFLEKYKKAKNAVHIMSPQDGISAPEKQDVFNKRTKTINEFLEKRKRAKDLTHILLSEGGISMPDHDFSNDDSIHYNSSLKNGDFSGAYGLHGNVDFSSFERLNLTDADLQPITSIKFNNRAKEIILSGAKGLRGVVKCNGMCKVSLCKTDLKWVVKFFGAKETNLKNATGLFGYFDFLKTDYLDMSGTDVSQAKVRFNPMAKKITLNRVKGLYGVLDFGNAEHVILLETDLSKVTKIICGPNTTLVGVTGFAGEIEYLTSKKLSKRIAGTKSVYRSIAKKQSAGRVQLVSKIKGRRR